nr:DUF2116 family Zn-ribbon domain-containing protein [Candidatus Sigynarchaeota archaeon]
MNFPTQIENDLFDYLSPQGKVEVEEHFAALEFDAPNECPNCNVVIGDRDSFCSKKCEEQFMGTADLMTREGPVLDEDRLRDEEQDR